MRGLPAQWLHASDEERMAIVAAYFRAAEFVLPPASADRAIARNVGWS